MSRSGVRAVAVAFPGAAPGTCRFCGQPCTVGRRSHPACAARQRDRHHHRAATLRDNGTRCAGCGRDDVDVQSEHIVPLGNGGSHDAHNRQPLCVECHRVKTRRESQDRARNGRGVTVGSPSRQWVRVPVAAAMFAAAPAWLLQHQNLLPPIGLLTVAVIVVGWRLQTRRWRRRAAAGRLLDAVCKATGTSMTSKGALRVTRWSGSQPMEWEHRYAQHFPDDDQVAAGKVEAAVARRAGFPVMVQWLPERGVVKFRPQAPGDDAAPVVDGAEATDPGAAGRPAEQRIRDALTAVIRGEVTLSKLRSDAEGPTEVTIGYPTTFPDHADEQRAAVQAMLNAKLHGRWRCDWDTQNDRVRAVRRPHMPAKVPHPAPTSRDPRVLPFALGEHGEHVQWDLVTAPHCLVAGQTGTGKTVVLRAIITEASYRGFTIYLCDPKRVELRGLRDWPGVKKVSTSTEDIVSTIESVHALMMRRYADLEADDTATAADLDPVMLVLDEARTFIDNANRAHKAAKGAGTEHPVIDMHRDIARLGRTARVHLLTGIQRPDAKVLGGEARDNYPTRISLGSLSPDGARMMYADGSVGRDVPASAKGRATCDVGDGPIEVQGYWTADPVLADDDERVVLDALRRPTLTKR